jgi:hypothetical protein
LDQPSDGRNFKAIHPVLLWEDALAFRTTGGHIT